MAPGERGCRGGVDETVWVECRYRFFRISIR